MNVFRCCCLALGSYIAIIIISIFQLVLYAVPNHIFLFQHLCRIFPDSVPENCQGSMWNQCRMLLTVGWPRNLKGSSYAAYKKTWMVTMVGHSQALLLLGAICTFSVPPIYLFFAPWSNAYALRSSDHQVMFIVAYVICVALVGAFWITSFSAVLTFDDIFKTVAGMDIETTSQSSSQPTTEDRRFSRRVSRRFLERISFWHLRRLVGRHLLVEVQQMMVRLGCFVRSRVLRPVRQGHMVTRWMNTI